MVQKRRILPYYLLIYYIPDGNDNLENFFQITPYSTVKLYLEIETDRLKATKAKNLLGQKKPPFLRIVVITFLGGKHQSNIKVKSLHIIARPIKINETMAHHISTNIQMKATAPHIAKNLTRNSNVFFITCYFFYFVYKVIAFFINYCNLENSEYLVKPTSCWLPPRTIS